jgi:uncharacterized protein (DUF2267 family)
VLRSFLHVLRDRLVVDEAAQVGAQLPMLIRGLYYEGWDPSRTPEKLGRQEFLGRFVGEAALPDQVPPENALRAAARTLRRHITEGEYRDVLVSLPADLQDLLA